MRAVGAIVYPVFFGVSSIQYKHSLRDRLAIHTTFLIFPLIRSFPSTDPFPSFDRLLVPGCIQYHRSAYSTQALIHQLRIPVPLPGSLGTCSPSYTRTSGISSPRSADMDAISSTTARYLGPSTPALTLPSKITHFTLDTLIPHRIHLSLPTAWLDIWRRPRSSSQKLVLAYLARRRRWSERVGSGDCREFLEADVSSPFVLEPSIRCCCTFSHLVQTMLRGMEEVCKVMSICHLIPRQLTRERKAEMSGVRAGVDSPGHDYDYDAEACQCTDLLSIYFDTTTTAASQSA